MTDINPPSPSFSLAKPALRAPARPALPPMPRSKRALDLLVALALALVLWPLLLGVALLLLLVEGRPILYLGERMASPERTFRQVKFRTMQVGADKVGGVTGGDKAGSISALHRVLRRTRLDELPQLWNVIRGDMSLVGPRPPLPRFVQDYPHIYGRVLLSRPGVTGLATLRFHAEEEKLLAACRTPDQTEAVYRRECIPRKARLDLMYQRHQSLLLDLRLIAETALRPFVYPAPRTVERRSARMIETSRRKGLLPRRRRKPKADPAAMAARAEAPPSPRTEPLRRRPRLAPPAIQPAE